MPAIMTLDRFEDGKRLTSEAIPHQSTGAFGQRDIVLGDNVHAMHASTRKLVRGLAGRTPWPCPRKRRWRAAGAVDSFTIRLSLPWPTCPGHASACQAPRAPHGTRTWHVAAPRRRVSGFQKSVRLVVFLLSASVSSGWFLLNRGFPYTRMSLSVFKWNGVLVVQKSARTTERIQLERSAGQTLIFRKCAYCAPQIQVLPHDAGGYLGRSCFSSSQNPSLLPVRKACTFL